MTRTRAVLAGAVLAPGLLVASACGVSTQKVSGDDVAQQVSSELTAKVGQKPDKVTCPSLQAVEGKKATCRLTAGGKTYDTAVTVTKVDGSNVSFSIEVANQPS